MNGESPEETQVRFQLQAALDAVTSAYESTIWGYTREFEQGQLSVAKNTLEGVLAQLQPPVGEDSTPSHPVVTKGMHDFWASKVNWCKAGDVTEEGHLCARIDGNHYIIREEKPKGYQGFLGFDGQKFKIKFESGPHTGQTIETTNLWHQGEIPPYLKEELPDNAAFESIGYAAHLRKHRSD